MFSPLPLVPWATPCLILSENDLQICYGWCRKPLTNGLEIHFNVASDGTEILDGQFFERHDSAYRSYSVKLMGHLRQSHPSKVHQSRPINTSSWKHVRLGMPFIINAGAPSWAMPTYSCTKWSSTWGELYSLVNFVSPKRGQWVGKRGTMEKS